MRRREFIVGLGGATVWPLVARAQKVAVPIIGFLGSVSLDENSRLYIAAFLQGLKESGYVEGQNYAIEYRWAEGRPEHLPVLVRDLVSRAAVIATYDTASAVAAKAATTTIPIVFATGGDPISFGLVISLARPSENITGVSFLNNALGSKRLGLLSELVSTASTFGFLVDPSNPNAAPETADMRAAADMLGHKLVVLEASTANEIDTAFVGATARRVDALAVAAHAFLLAQTQQLVDLALRHRLPTIYPFREAAKAGGLLSYGGSLAEAFRHQGIYAARILKGEKPMELPIQQVTRFEMILNLRTAKALGLNVPNNLLATADEVIE
jgi:putative tryptophan/tyrosine transport system substrate-binding protein